MAAPPVRASLLWLTLHPHSHSAAHSIAKSDIVLILYPSHTTTVALNRMGAQQLVNSVKYRQCMPDLVSSCRTLVPLKRAAVGSSMYYELPRPGDGTHHHTP